MKKTFLIFFAFFYLTTAYCQSTEITINLNSGLFSFSGKSATRTSVINYDLRNETGYTNNPYGSEGSLSLGVSAGLNRVTKSKMLVGLDLGYELLRSRTIINAVSVYNGTTNETMEADGKTILHSNVINLFPKIGYRFSSDNLNFDLSVGFDLAYFLRATEKGSAATAEREFKTHTDRNTIPTDIRPRIQINVNKGKYGAYLGYSAGLRNFQAGYVGGIHEAYGNMLRFGLNYVLN